MSVTRSPLPPHPHTHPLAQENGILKVACPVEPGHRGRVTPVTFRKSSEGKITTNRMRGAQNQSEKMREEERK